MAARSRSEKRLEAAYNESQGRSLVQRKHTILRLGRYMIQYKWLLLLAFIMTVGSNLLALVGPSNRVWGRWNFREFSIMPDGWRHFT